MCALVRLTQIYLQQQLRFAQFEGDVVSLLAFPVENHTIALRGLEPQRYHVLDDLHLFHLHKQAACYLFEGPWKEWV